jgi:hypothetical protein
MSRSWTDSIREVDLFNLPGFNTAVDKIESILSTLSFTTSSADKGHILKMSSHMVDVEALFSLRIRDLRKSLQKIRNPVSPSRKRRSPFDFVGDVGSSLFGLATESDVQAIAEANRVLGRAVDGIVNTQNQIVGSERHGSSPR